MFDNLVSFRKSIGLGQKEFAESIGYKRTTYSNYESGLREPGSDLKSLASASLIKSLAMLK